MILAIASNGSIIQLKIGGSKPDIKNRITSLTASGPELARIKQQFVNLIYPRGNEEVMWRGDLAQFIFDNLE